MHNILHMIFKKKWLPVLLLTISSVTVSAQQTDTLIRLKDAVTIGEQRYHLLKAQEYNIEAADGNVNVVKYSRLPSLDISYQAGISTANNLIGTFYPTGILPISGPPTSGNKFEPGTGSAAAVLLNWQAVTFGERNARINVAVSEAAVQKAGLQKERFQHTINIISCYLDVLLFNANLSIHQHNIERVEANLRQSRVLANSGIKAGVDTALFQSELSKAKIEYINASRQLETLQWKLARLIVLDHLPVPQDSLFLFQLPSIPLPANSDFSLHPSMQYAQSQFSLSQSKEQQIKKSYLPKINIWGTGFARGSGFQADGTLETWEGMKLSRYNYSAGLQLVFPIMKYGEAKRQLQQQAFLSKAAAARLEDQRSELSVQQQIANTTFTHSLQVASETNTQLKSAQTAFHAMQIRYNTGLVNFSDLIQTQYNLLKSELDLKQSYWDAWKALLLEAAVKGDVTIFLNEIR